MGLPLVTLAEYKAYVGISSTNQDATISSIIPKVSQLVKNICGRTFVDYVNDSKTDTFSGGYYLTPSEYPVLSISSVEYSSDFGATYTSLVEFTDYVFDVETESIAPLWRDMFTKTPNGYKVTFTAGFEEIPEDLKIAVLDLISYYLKNDAAVHSSRQLAPGTMQVEYLKGTALPAHIKRVLDLYVARY